MKQTPATGCVMVIMATIFVFGVGPYLVVEALSVFFPPFEITFRHFLIVMGLFILLAFSMTVMVAMWLAIYFQKIDERKAQPTRSASAACRARS